MAIRDILLQMNSYPEPTPTWAIDSAAYKAERLDAKLSAGLCQVEIPDVSNYLSQLLVRSKDLIAAENRKSAENATQLMLHFDGVLGPDRFGESIIIACPGLVTPWKLSERARIYDLTVMPIYGHTETGSMIEGMVFDAGRPVLLLPPEGVAGHRFDDVVIGWDGSRAAARALGDALSFCKRASSVTVVAVTGEKSLPKETLISDVARHLSRHGIPAKFEEINAHGHDAGTALRSHCKDRGADLLVMGAYGHTRAREFVLGGATRSILREQGIPVLMSH